MIVSTHHPGFPRLNCVDLRAGSGLPCDTLMQPVRSILPARAGPFSAFKPWLVSLLVLGLCGVSPCNAAQRSQKRPNAHHQIDELEEVWRDAVLSSNTTAMDSLLADDYTAITANGTLQTKQDWLASLRSGRVHFTTLNVSDRKVRFYGDTAVVTSRVEVRGTGNDGEVFGSFRYTRVYVRSPQGKWKIVSFEASRIRKSHDIGIESAQ
ncbi:MAG TPA: nuclear transport factor 2 family protein [Terracidiphilus sp.]|nr:nuclear transport factor 2 family protein [Terracidiphilus sp.]